MKNKRRRHENAFKARVALEAIKNTRTIQEIAKDYEIHPVQVSDWKKQMLTNAASIFDSKKANNQEQDQNQEREKLHAKIGQQAVEIDFLIKKSKQLGL